MIALAVSHANQNSELPPAVEVRGLTRSFGQTRAVVGVDFEVPRGSVTALLGPNGAGKTTTVRMLATLLRIHGGSARVGGSDVSEEPDAVRSKIGLTGQDTAVDELLTGRENLVLIARLQRMPAARAGERAEEMLRRVGLLDAADRRAGTYSGGMRRRLDLAASMVNDPEVLFLDEPTTGLDPRSRIEIWEMIEELVERGTTVLLTTQYLDEADQLADDIIVIDHGRVIARGSSDALKREVGGHRLEFSFADGVALKVAVAAVEAAGGEVLEIDQESSTLNVALVSGAGQIASLIETVEAAGVAIEEVFVHRPTLDDVFLRLTGEHVEDEAGEEQR